MYNIIIMCYNLNNISNKLMVLILHVFLISHDIVYCSL